MTIDLLSDMFRGSRRIRLQFSGPLASGAFTTLSLYSVASADSTGPSPIDVEALFAISTDPNSVEIAVDVDFTPGGEFTVTCTNVPAADASLFTGSITDRVGQPTSAPPNVEPETSDIDVILYSTDLAWGSFGFAEDTTGDLQTISGRPNWQNAMSRAMISSGITWDADYGAKAEQSVDAPSAYQPALAGRFLAQARRDNRTKSATIVFGNTPGDPNGSSFAMSILGRDGLGPIVLNAPVPQSGI